MQKFCLKKAGQLHSVLRCGNIYFRGFVSSGQLLKKGLEMRLKHEKNCVRPFKPVQMHVQFLKIDTTLLLLRPLAINATE